MVRHDLRTNMSAHWYAPVPHPSSTHKHTNEDLHKFSCVVLLHIFLVTLKCRMQVGGLAEEEKDVRPAAQNTG